MLSSLNLPKYLEQGNVNLVTSHNASQPNRSNKRCLFFNSHHKQHFSCFEMADHAVHITNLPYK